MKIIHDITSWVIENYDHISGLCCIIFRENNLDIYIRITRNKQQEKMLRIIFYHTVSEPYTPRGACTVSKTKIEEISWYPSSSSICFWLSSLEELVEKFYILSLKEL